MVSGQLKCLGSCQHLKNRFGSGYQFEIRCSSHLHPTGRGSACGDSEGDDCHQRSDANLEEVNLALGTNRKPSTADIVWNECKRVVPSLYVEEIHDYYLRLRTDGAIDLSNSFFALQKMKEKGLVLDYNISQATLEQIFISFAREQEEEMQRPMSLAQTDTLTNTNYPVKPQDAIIINSENEKVIDIVDNNKVAL